MARQLPDSLKGYTVFLDGRGYGGRLNSGKLPVIKMKTEDFRDRGMDTEVALEMGRETMDAELGFADLDSKIHGLVGKRGVAITVRGPMDDESGVVQTAIGEPRGVVTEAEPGDRKSEVVTGEVKMMVSPDYYLLRIARQEVYEINVINGGWRMNGIDSAGPFQ